MEIDYVNAWKNLNLANTLSRELVKDIWQWMWKMNMIRNYIIERRSWIIIFILIQILLLFIAYLDPSISFKSFLYMYFLFYLLFITFILILFHNEIAFYNIFYYIS